MTPEEMQARLDELKEKLKDETLTDDERTAIEEEIKEMEDKIGAEKFSRGLEKAVGPA